MPGRADIPAAQPGRRRNLFRSTAEHARALFSRAGIYLWLTLAFFALSAVFVNPLRETPFQDDWSYSLTVRQLVQTHHYELNEWASPNIVFQAYWGALFSQVAGYSFAALRLSTLVLWLLGMIAFCALAREHGFDQLEAGLLVLVLSASPYLAQGAFTFLSEVPFVSCLVISLWLYSRGWRLGSGWLMLLGSFAATAAILTRQFGIALAVALLLVWLLETERLGKARLVALGLVLPISAALFQLQAGLVSPTWSMRYDLHWQRAFLARLCGDGMVLVRILLGRPLLILSRVAIFMLPLVILLAVEVVRNLRMKSGARSLRRAFTIASLYVAVMVAGIALTGRSSQMLLAWPPAALWPDAAQLLLISAGVVGAFLLCTIVLLELKGLKKWPQLSPATRLAAILAVCLAAQIMFFHQFDERYVLPLLPCAILLAGHACRPQLTRFKPVVAACCVLLLLLTAVDTRVKLSRNEALWQAAESLHARGVPPCKIDGAYEWAGYYCSDAFFRQKPELSVKSYIDWHQRQEAEASYSVSEQLPNFAGTFGVWRIAGTREYSLLPLIKRRVYVLERTP